MLCTTCQNKQNLKNGVVNCFRINQLRFCSEPQDRLIKRLGIQATLKKLMGYTFPVRYKPEAIQACPYYKEA